MTIPLLHAQSGFILRRWLIPVPRWDCRPPRFGSDCSQTHAIGNVSHNIPQKTNIYKRKMFAIECRYVSNTFILPKIHILVDRFFAGDILKFGLSHVFANLLHYLTSFAKNFQEKTNLFSKRTSVQLSELFSAPSGNSISVPMFGD